MHSKFHIIATDNSHNMRMYWLIYQCKITTQLFAMGKPYRKLPEAMSEEMHQQIDDVSAPGQHEWPALLRRLDRIAPHYKT